jgi:hypothetical protein
MPNDRGNPDNLNFPSWGRAMSETEEVMAKSRQLLRRPVPDTFAGRKTQEPFPKEKKSKAASSDGYWAR